MELAIHSSSDESTQDSSAESSQELQDSSAESSQELSNSSEESAQELSELQCSKYPPGYRTQIGVQCPRLQQFELERLELPDVMRKLDSWDSAGLQLDSCTYLVRTINFTHIARNHPKLLPLARQLENAGRLLAPLQHHGVVFSVKQPAAHPDNATADAYLKETIPFQHLLVHLQTRGVVGLLSRETFGLLEEWRCGAAEGHIKPRWISTILNRTAGRSYAPLSWNCQHFARDLAVSVGDECLRDLGNVSRCESLNFQHCLPVVIYERGRLLAFAVVCAACAILSVRRRCCCVRKSRQTDAGENGDDLLTPLIAH